MSGICRLAVALAAAAVVLPATAVAQESNPLVRERISVSNSQPPAPPVRVQLAVNFFMPGSGDEEETNKLRERARRSIYEMANGECTVLEQVMAKSCRLEAIMVNVNTSRPAN